MRVISSDVMVENFYEEFVLWLELNEIRYISKVKFEGGYNYLFDFVIPKSKRQPERILQIINDLSWEEVLAFVFAWSDVKKVRSSKAYGLFNDLERKISPAIFNLFRKYGIKLLLWTQLEEEKWELIS